MPREPFVDLRYVSIQHVDFLVVNIVDGDNDIGAEWLRTSEVVVKIKKDRVLAKRGYFTHYVGHGDHIGGILHQDAGVAMVGMVIVGTRSEHDVGIPLAYFPDDLLADRNSG